MGGGGCIEWLRGEIELNAVASVVFGFVKGRVCGLEEFSEFLCVLGEGGHADGYGDIEDFGVMSVGTDVEFGDLCAQAVSETEGSVDVGFFEEDSEFFAAVACSKIDLSEGGLKDLGDLMEDAIPCGVAVGIVDPFEVIEVEHDHGERPFEAACGFELCVCAFHQGAVVEKSRQSVARGEVFHACEVLEVREQGSDVVGECAEVLLGFFGGKGLCIACAECDHADGLVM